jgi:DNA-binding transcriptional MerR regulator
MNSPTGSNPIDNADPIGGLPAIDGKDAAAFRTIGEVANALGIRQHVLRYWEEHFPMLRPLTRAGGRRYYRPEDVALVMKIDRLLNLEGYTIKGARQALRGGKGPARQPVTPAAPRLVEAASDANPSGAGGAGTTTSLQFPDPGLVAALLALRNRLAAALVD